MSTSAFATSCSTRSRPSGDLRSAVTERRLRSIASRRRIVGLLRRPLDPDHVGTEIAEDHRRVRARADAGQLDDPQSVKWSRHDLHPPLAGREVCIRRQSLLVQPTDGWAAHWPRTPYLWCLHDDHRNGLDTLTPVDDLIVNLTDGVLSVTIDRPDSLNSLTPRMLDDHRPTLERAATDPRVRVVRFGGAGRGFSSGAGISAERQPATATSRWRRCCQANRAVRAIVNLPQAGRRRGAGSDRRRRGVAGAGVRSRTGLGEGVLPVGVHQDRADARRRRVGVGGRVDRSHPGDEDGTAGRTVARRRRAGGGPGQRGVPRRGSRAARPPR